MKPYGKGEPQTRTHRDSRPKRVGQDYKSILNCKRVAAIADRVYIYDNSVDDAEARLLFRMTDGRPFKRYTDDIPEWALTILNF